MPVSDDKKFSLSFHLISQLHIRVYLMGLVQIIDMVLLRNTFRIDWTMMIHVYQYRGQINTMTREPVIVQTLIQKMHIWMPIDTVYEWQAKL